MAMDMFLKVKTIPGESTDDKHKEWIEVLSFSWGVSQTGAGSRSSGGAAAAERCNHSDFSVVHTLDKASPKFFLSCCKGEHIGEVKLELCRATGAKTKYMEYKMEDVIITSVRPGGSAQGGESLPLEEVSFNYGKITLDYIQTDHKTGASQGSAGSVYWDVTANKGQ